MNPGLFTLGSLTFAATQQEYFPTISLQPINTLSLENPRRERKNHSVEETGILNLLPLSLPSD